MQLQFSDLPGFCECGCGQEVGFREKTDPSQGRVTGQPKRFAPGHNIRVKHPRKKGERLALEIRDMGYSTPCHLWTGWVSPDGYGRTRRDGDRRARQVHRIYYEAKHGPLLPGLDLHHECGVPACANPDHLRPVGRSEHGRHHASTNPLPRDAAGRWTTAHVCNNGWVSIGQEIIDPETGEESVEYALYLCRRCSEAGEDSAGEDS